MRVRLPGPLAMTTSGCGGSNKPTAEGKAPVEQADNPPASPSAASGEKPSGIPDDAVRTMRPLESPADEDAMRITLRVIRGPSKGRAAADGSSGPT